MTLRAGREAPPFLRAMRPRHWSKNLLLFLPELLAHRWGDISALMYVAIGFIAFSLATSALYIINDLTDLAHDRVHSTKRYRALAMGALKPVDGLSISVGLAVLSLGIVVMMPSSFAGWLGVYALLSLTYSLRLKRIVLLDVFALGVLYVLRLLAGGAAAGVVVSQWLLAFGFCFFIGLAFVKRTSEALSMGRDFINIPGRGYSRTDVGKLIRLGTTAGAAATIILFFYFESPQTQKLYSRPALLWIAGAVILLWQVRLWTLLRHGALLADPVVFALRDRTSIACAVALAAIILAAC